MPTFLNRPRGEYLNDTACMDDAPLAFLFGADISYI